MSRVANPLSLYNHQYPDPFLDIASTRLPKTQRKLLELCYIFGTQHPQISPIIKKLAKYPITKIVVDTEDNVASLNKKWKDILEDEIGIYEIAEEVGLNYLGYGNVFVVIHKPFARFYTCKGCGASFPGGKLDYFLRKNSVYAKCPKCKGHHEFDARDEILSKNYGKIRVVLLDPKEVIIEPNKETRENWYFYNVSSRLKKAVKGAKPNRRIIDSTPWIYVKAAINKKKVEFSGSSILHLREPSMVGPNNGWGLPIILAAMKDAYLNQIYKKADESMANERVVPARFVFPQPTTADPLRNISLSKWARFMGNSIRNYRYDKNAIMPVPFPVGTATIGGDAQQWNTLPMRQQQVREIIGATGVPEGFLSSEMNWSGGSVQLRILENSIMGYLRAQDKLLKYIVSEISKISRWDECTVKFKPFSKADDVQMLQLIIQLAQMDKVPWREALERLDIDSEEIKEVLESEAQWTGRLNSMKAMNEAKAMLDAADVQVEAQSRGEDYSYLRNVIRTTSDSTMDRLSNPAKSLSEHYADNQEEEANQQPGPSAKEQKEMAEAKLDDAKAELISSSAVSRLAKRLSNMSPERAASFIDRIRASAPQTAQQLESSYDPQEVDMDEPQAVLDELRQTSSTPNAMANKLIMLKPEVRKGVFRLLQKEDPSLAMRVSKVFMLERANQAKSQSIDMRPQPEQKPPRRK